MSTSTATTIPGYVTGTWTIDPVHSEVGFLVRHMMVSKVAAVRHVLGVHRPRTCSLTVTASVDLTSIDTGNEDREPHPLGRLLRRRGQPR
jgi:polyisoprenoid-binding protein YceI